MKIGGLNESCTSFNGINTLEAGKQKIAILLNRPDDTITPADPTFEDAFMALVLKGDTQLQTSSPTLTTPWVTESASGDKATVITNSLCKKFGGFYGGFQSHP